MISTKILVLLDRDGTIIEDKHYLYDPEQIVLLTGVVQGMRLLRKAGCALALVTNQSGIGRGLFDEAALEAMHVRLLAMLASAGITLDGMYVCPHAPSAVCSCRKPATALAESAARDLGFDLTDIIVIGDKAADVDLGLAVGGRGILVRTGKGLQADAALLARANYVADDVLDAAQWIITSRALLL